MAGSVKKTLEPGLLAASAGAYQVTFKTGQKKYRQLYIYLLGLLESGELAPGEALLPIRKASRSLGVNPSTVVKAYDLLEKQNKIIKKEGSGCYVQGLAYQEKPVPGRLAFDRGDPPAKLFPRQAFKKALDRAITENDAELFEVTEGQGYQPLRQVLCERLKEQGIYSTPQRMQIVSGAQQGIQLVASWLGYRGSVVVEEPSYAGALEVFREKSLKIHSVPLNKDGIDLGRLRQKIQQKRPQLLYLMPNCHNPTGLTYSREVKERVLALAREFDFYILEDDAFSDIRFAATEHRPLRFYDKWQKVIYVKSFSKILMPGLRIALLEMPQDLQRSLEHLKSSADRSTSSISQLALYNFLKDPAWPDHLRQMDQIYSERYQIAATFLKKNLPESFELFAGSGGLNFFLRVPAPLRVAKLEKFLAGRGISITPGRACYAASGDDRSFRISIAALPKEQLIESLQKLLENLQMYRDASKIDQEEERKDRYE